MEWIGVGVGFCFLCADSSPPEANLNCLKNPDFQFRICPRCQGNLVFSGDHYGDAWSCIQCGYMQDCERKLAVVTIRPYEREIYKWPRNASLEK